MTKLFGVKAARLLLLQTLLLFLHSAEPKGFYAEPLRANRKGSLKDNSQCQNENVFYRSCRSENNLFSMWMILRTAWHINVEPFLVDLSGSAKIILVLSIESLQESLRHSAFSVLNSSFFKSSLWHSSEIIPSDPPPGFSAEPRSDASKHKMLF